MTTKKIKIVKEESDKRVIKIVQSTDVTVPKKSDSFWQRKTAAELAKEQGIRPIKDERDFARRIVGGLEEWDDIDEFLEEVHKPWK